MKGLVCVLGGLAAVMMIWGVIFALFIKIFLWLAVAGAVVGGLCMLLADGENY